MKKVEQACEQGCVCGGGFGELMWFIIENHSAAQEATVVKDSLGSLLRLYKVELFFFRLKQTGMQGQLQLPESLFLRGRLWPVMSSSPTLSHILFCVKSSWCWVTKSSLFPAPWPASTLKTEIIRGIKGNPTTLSNPNTYVVLAPMWFPS